MPIEPGVRLGAYEVREILGRGAMGVVYRAFHADLNRQAAVKVLQALAPDPEAGARFRREAQSIAQMRHPNVLQVFDYGEYEGVPYSIVEFVPGGSLADRLRSGQRLSHTTAISFLEGLAAALDYAHGLGVVHRDVKPANVLLGKDDLPVLADFGLAKLLQSASVRSMSGVTTGTPAYMSPEQITGGDIGPAADRYALATVAYELLTGELPFEGEGVMELLYAHVHRRPPPASSRDAGLGPAVDAVLLKGLAKAPEERWASCREMVSALEAALRRGPAIEAGASAVIAEQVAEIPMTGVGPGAPKPMLAADGSPKRKRRGLVLGSVGLLALIAIAAVFGVSIMGSTVGASGPTGVGGGQAVSIGLSRSEVAAGDSLVVTAQHLPAHQEGTVKIQSTPQQVGTFRADANGITAAEAAIPRRFAPLGKHTLTVCWAFACHGSAAITVLAQIPPNAPTPTTTTSATPRAGFHPEITTVLPSPVRIKGQVFVSGAGFDPASRGIVVVLIQYGHDGQTVGVQDRPVEPSGSFTFEGTVPAGNFVPGQAVLRVCNIGESDLCADRGVTLSN